MNKQLKRYIKAGKRLYLTANDAGTKWEARYIVKGELIRVWISDFMTKEEEEEARALENNANWEGRNKVYKKIAKRITYAKVCQPSPNTWFYFHCNAGNTSRALEVVLSIGDALGLDFHDIPQSYTVL